MDTSVMHSIDAATRDRVELELGWSQQITDPARIGVVVHGGVATLTGSVPTYSQKVAAGDAALNTRGVTAVANDIDVRWGSQHDDTAIAERARDALALNTKVPHDAIHLQVSHGTVTLTGTVPWEFQRRAARATIANVAGVKHVVDSVTLPSRASSTQTRDHIRSAFARLANLDANRIDVQVSGTSVTLTGTVSSHAEKVAAARAAWNSPHVTAVDNRLRIAVE